uniref:(northern house mosquito) hypothetical protein n=1 Tax=Culex pipiens TaxID=7175 RepID=A0A8D8EX55_CULPI
MAHQVSPTTSSTDREPRATTRSSPQHLIFVSVSFEPVASSSSASPRCDDFTCSTFSIFTLLLIKIVSHSMVVVPFQHLTILSVLLCTLVALSSLAAVEFTTIVNGSPVEEPRLLPPPPTFPEVAAEDAAVVEVDTVVAASTTTVDGGCAPPPDFAVNAFSSSDGPRIMQHTRFTISRLITNRFAVVRRLGVTQKAPSARIFTPIELTSNPPTRQSTANIVEFHFSSSLLEPVSSFFAHFSLLCVYKFLFSRPSFRLDTERGAFLPLQLSHSMAVSNQRCNWYRSFIVSTTVARDSTLRLSHSFPLSHTQYLIYVCFTSCGTALWVSSSIPRTVAAPRTFCTDSSRYSRESVRR